MDFWKDLAQIPVNGKSVVLLSVLKGRTDEQIRQLLSSHGGNILFLQSILAVDSAIACFETEVEAAQIVTALRGKEEIHFAEVRHRINTILMRET